MSSFYLPAATMSHDDYLYDDDDESDQDDVSQKPAKRKRGRPKGKGKNAPGKQLRKKGV